MLLDQDAADRDGLRVLKAHIPQLIWPAMLVEHDTHSGNTIKPMPLATSAKRFQIPKRTAFLNLFGEQL